MTESRKLAAFCLKSKKLKNKKLLFHSLVSLSELYGAAEFHKNSILFWKTSYNFARSLSQKKMIRERLIDGTQKLVANLISGNKIKDAVKVIVEHVLFTAYTHEAQFSKIDYEGIQSLMVSRLIASQTLTKINNTLKKTKNPVLQSILHQIKQTTLGSC